METRNKAAVVQPGSSKSKSSNVSPIVQPNHNGVEKRKRPNRNSPMKFENTSPDKVMKKGKQLDIRDMFQNAQKGKETKSAKYKRKYEVDSFVKYGCLVPTFDKIIEDQKKIEHHKHVLDQLNAIDWDEIDNFTPINFDEPSCSEEVEILDCRHFTLKEIKDSFKEHLPTLEKIINGAVFSDRHDTFHSCNANPMALTASSSIVVFTQDQNEYVIDLMTRQFDPEDKLTKYFFQVLLPEFCLLVFMSHHHMSKQEALSYLAKRPLDDL